MYNLYLLTPIKVKGFYYLFSFFFFCFFFLFLLPFLFYCSVLLTWWSSFLKNFHHANGLTDKPDLG